jgi:hypothetical protein
MKEDLSATREFRLHSEGQQCDEAGLTFCGVPLLQRTKPLGGQVVWSPKPPDEIEPAMSARFGAPVALARTRAQLDFVARCLTTGDVALAQIATLHLRLPDPPPLAKASLPPSSDLVAQLIASGLLARDWNPDAHPRTGTPPNPSWFAPRDDGGYEVAENDKEPPPTMTDESPEPPPSGDGSTAPGVGAGAQGQPTSVREQARQTVRDLRGTLQEIAGRVLQGAEIALWASDALANKLDDSLNELKFLLQLPLSLAEAERDSVLRRQAEVLAAQDPPKTLAELQTPPIENIEGHDLHHVVQQTDSNVQKDRTVAVAEKFGRDMIDSPRNLVWVPRLKHQLITGYYNSLVPTSNGSRFRRLVAGDLDFEAQYQDGLASLRLYGVLQ